MTGQPPAARLAAGTPVVDMHAHLAVPAAEALVAGALGLAAEARAEQEAHSAHSLEVNRAQLTRLIPVMGDPQRRLADMDAMGVDIQAVGPMPMHHYWADRALAADFARATNEGIAAFCARAPARLVGLGTVPLQHPDLAAAELRHAVGALGLRGVSVSTTVAGRELADAAHEPFWAAAEQAGVPVLIHPWGCSLGPRLAAHYLGNIVGQPAETTIALSHLIFSGLLDRHPGLRICACHGGGYLPVYIGRSDHAWLVRPDAHGCARRPSEYLGQMWYDSLVFTTRGLEHLAAVAGADRIVLGTDYPFDMGVADPLPRLEDATGLSPSDRAAISGRTAAGLLGLDPVLASAPAAG
jgi:aminocarboxymuconate-semialdehyde decarboxylase